MGSDITFQLSNNQNVCLSVFSVYSLNICLVLPIPKISNISIQILQYIYTYFLKILYYKKYNNLTDVSYKFSSGNYQVLFIKYSNNVDNYNDFQYN